MVKYLLKAGADQEHKTDEMHTALMEASMVINRPEDFSREPMLCFMMLDQENILTP